MSRVLLAASFASGGFRTGGYKPYRVLGLGFRVYSQGSYRVPQYGALNWGTPHLRPNMEVSENRGTRFGGPFQGESIPFWGIHGVPLFWEVPKSLARVYCPGRPS